MVGQCAESKNYAYNWLRLLTKLNFTSDVISAVHRNTCPTMYKAVSDGPFDVQEGAGTSHPIKMRGNCPPPHFSEIGVLLPP